MMFKSHETLLRGQKDYKSDLYISYRFTNNLRIFLSFKTSSYISLI